MNHYLFLVLAVGFVILAFFGAVFGLAYGSLIHHGDWFQADIHGTAVQGLWESETELTVWSDYECYRVTGDPGNTHEYRPCTHQEVVDAFQGFSIYLYENE